MSDCTVPGPAEYDVPFEQCKTPTVYSKDWLWHKNYALAFARLSVLLAQAATSDPQAVTFLTLKPPPVATVGKYGTYGNNQMLVPLRVTKRICTPATCARATDESL